MQIFRSLHTWRENFRCNSF